MKTTIYRYRYNGLNLTYDTITGDGLIIIKVYSNGIEFASFKGSSNLNTLHLKYDFLSQFC